MKKTLALLLALVMVLSLAACGQSKPAETKPAETKPAETKPAETKPAEETPAEPAEEDPMAALIAAAQAEGELVVYGSCEEEYLSAACENFEKRYAIKTT